MELADVVTEIVDEMEKEIKESATVELGSICKSYIKQLRIAVKASSKETITPPIDADITKRINRSEAKKISTKMEEEMVKVARADMGPRMIPLEGGGEDGVLFEMAGNVPANAFVPINDKVFQYKPEDSKLVYHEVATENYLKRMKGE